MGDFNPGVSFESGQIVYASTLNKLLGDATLKDKAVTKEKLDDALRKMFDDYAKGYFGTFFNVGDVFPSNRDDLTERFGGTWALIKGKFLFGADPDGDDPKYPLGKEGGTESNTLTADQLPRHRHRMFNATYDDGGYLLRGRPDAYASLYGGRQPPYPHDGDWLYEINSGLSEPTYGWSGYVGGTKDENGNVKDAVPINNMPPYRCMYLWEKVSDLLPEDFKKSDPEAYEKYFGSN